MILFAAIFLLSACGAKRDNPGEDLREQISAYRQQALKLNEQIAALEQELAANDENPAHAIPVETMTLTYRPFRHYIDVSGTVEAIQSAYISPEINGQIKNIYVNEGDRVQKGDPLVKLNSSVTEQGIREVETALELARTVYKKQKELWDQNIGSEIEFLTARNNMESLESRLSTLKAQHDMALVLAPVNGIVDEIMVKEGELGIPGMRMMELVNLDELYINADVSETYLTKVKRGDAVVVDFPAYPGISMEVPVHRTGNVVKSANRTFTVQLKIRNRDEMLKPNSLAVVRISDFSSDSALLVPPIIVKQDMKGKYLYTVAEKNGNPVASKRYIQTGLSYGDETMVTEGLEPGESVIITGYNQVTDGIAVRNNGNKF